MSKNTLLLIVACMVAALLGFALGRNSDFDLEIKSGDKSAKLAVKGGAVDYEKVLETIYANDFLRGAARQWLSDKHGVVAIADTGLASAIERKACDKIPDAPWQSKIQALKACAETPRNSQLRDLALRRRAAPFHPVGAFTRMSIPDHKRDIPPTGGANICDRDLLGRKIEVYNPELSKSIYVTPTGHIPCSGVAEIGTHLHLHPDDAAKLFGGFRPTGIHMVYVQQSS